MRTFLIVTAIALSALALPTAVPTAVEAATTLTRAEIRAMPIHNRPDRRGHFYGNTVRRRAR